MTLPVVLDADALADPSPPSAFRAMLSGAGSVDLADAHVVVVCARRGGDLVITSDPDDIARLAVAVPAVRVVTRPTR